MIDFQGKIREFISDFPSTSSASQFANNYFTQNYYGSSKETEWTQLKAGSIYTFDYPIKSPEELSESFIDRRPLLMILPTPGNYPKGKIVGLDLVLLRPDLRANFLMNLSSVIDLRFLEDEIINPEEISEKLSKMNLSFSRKLLAGFPIEKIVKGYDIRYISGFKEISMSDWTKIPYLNDFKIQGTTLNKIYNS